MGSRWLVWATALCCFGNKRSTSWWGHHICATCNHTGRSVLIFPWKWVQERAVISVHKGCPMSDGEVPHFGLIFIPKWITCLIGVSYLLAFAYQELILSPRHGWLKMLHWRLAVDLVFWQYFLKAPNISKIESFMQSPIISSLK